MDAEIFTDPELKKYHGNERTEEVRDIIDRMPTKFGYWVSGIVVFFFLIVNDLWVGNTLPRYSNRAING